MRLPTLCRINVLTLLLASPSLFGLELIYSSSNIYEGADFKITGLTNEGYKVRIEQCRSCPITTIAPLASRVLDAKGNKIELSNLTIGTRYKTESLSLDVETNNVISVYILD